MKTSVNDFEKEKIKKKKKEQNNCKSHRKPRFNIHISPNHGNIQISKKQPFIERKSMKGYMRGQGILKNTYRGERKKKGTFIKLMNLSATNDIFLIKNNQKRISYLTTKEKIKKRTLSPWKNIDIS